MSEHTALIPAGADQQIALLNAASLWADSSTAATTLRRKEIMHDKIAAVRSFFEHARKHPAAVKPANVRAWLSQLEEEGLRPATIYARASRLSSFYEWIMRDPQLRETITANPVKQARPRAPRAYQGESINALSDKEVDALLAVIKTKAEAGSITAKRDYALTLFFLATGMRRNEVIGLRGRNIEERDDCLIIKSFVKGGDYRARELSSMAPRAALYEYLEASGRSRALKTDAPLWTRHDRAGKPGAAMTSHAFALNLKAYAKEAGIESIHIHQIRHTFARIVADDSGSMLETQEALGHRNLATTKVYVQRITVKRDKHSDRIMKRAGLG
jgi:site-specific recombinase XerD